MNRACIFDVEFAASDTVFDIGVESLQVIKVSELPPYEGSYTVDALVKAPVILPTKGRNMTDDITIKKIRQLEVGNTAGGNTLIIGEDL